MWRCCSQLVQYSAGHGAASIQIAVMLPLAYTCFCAYYSLFKLGNFSSYKMVCISRVVNRSEGRLCPENHNYCAVPTKRASYNNNDGSGTAA